MENNIRNKKKGRKEAKRRRLETLPSCSDIQMESTESPHSHISSDYSVLFQTLTVASHMISPMNCTIQGLILAWVYTRDLAGAITALLDGSIASLAEYRLRYTQGYSRGINQVVCFLQVSEVGMFGSFSRIFHTGRVRFLVRNERDHGSDCIFPRYAPENFFSFTEPIRCYTSTSRLVRFGINIFPGLRCGVDRRTVHWFINIRLLRLYNVRSLVTILYVLLEAAS